MIPPLTALKSTALSGVHYDPATSRLTVKFTSGKHWEFDGVPMEKAETLAGNASPGSYFSRKIRGLYNGREISG